VNNGWYYWNAGYWFPAWGYAPSVSYVYDGPIYGYNGLSPDQGDGQCSGTAGALPVITMDRSMGSLGR
jgi:hypothetical protein